MKTRTVAPLSARILSIVSLVLSLLWLIAYAACVIFQRDLRIMLGSPAEIINSFRVPLAPLLTCGLILLIQTVFAILLLAFWHKAVWVKGAAITMITVEAVLVALQNIFGGLVNVAETMYVGQMMGSTALAAQGTVNQTLAYAGGFFSAAVICMLAALALLVYRCGIDTKAQKMGGYQP